MKNNYEDDDNRVIADMSNVTRKNQNTFFNLDNKASDQEVEKLSAKNTFFAILGSLSASLLIGIIYIVVFGLFILMLYLLFKNKLGN